MTRTCKLFILKMTANSSSNNVAGQGVSVSKSLSGNGLEEERQQKLKLLTEYREMIKKLVSEKTNFFQNLIFEGNDVSDRFVQFKVWRDRYSDSNSKGNPSTFLMAFTEVDRQIQMLTQIFTAFDAKLLQTSEFLHSYLRFMDVQFTWLQDNIELAKVAVSMKQLSTLWTPDENWMKTFPNPKLEELADEWKRLQLMPKLDQCFRQMQALIKFIASNGDL